MMTSNVLDFHFASFCSGLVYVALERGLFESIEKGKTTLGELVPDLRLPHRSVKVMLASLEAFQLVIRTGESYRLSEDTRTYLLKESDKYLGGWLLSSADDGRNRDLDYLRKTVVQGISDDALAGDFSFLIEDPVEAQKFSQVMHSKSFPSSLAWPKAIDLEGYETFLDIGGGVGTHSYALCEAWPELTGTILEIPAIAPMSHAWGSSQRLYGNRVDIMTGDMWTDPFPPVDVHFFSDIFHDWSFEKCRFLVEKSFQALNPGGTIIIHEMLYRNGQVPTLNVAGYDAAMFLHTEEGQQYSDGELLELLTQAGFQECAVKRTFDDWSVVTGKKYITQTKGEHYAKPN